MREKQRWLRLMLALAALLLAGIIYAWSFFKVPLAELFSGASKAQLQLNYTLTLCFFCLGGLASGFMAKRVSIRARMCMGAALVCLGFIIVSRLSGNSLFMLYLGYGVMAGTGIGFVYNTVISTTNAWFPDRKGLASGAMMLGFGFSAMVLGNLASALFGPMGWRSVFLMYALVIGASLAAIGWVMRMPKPGEVPAVAAAAAADSVDYDTKAMLKRPSCWMLFISVTLICITGSVAIGQSRELIISIDAGATAMAAMGASMISVMNGAGRMIWGALFDKLGLRRTQYLLCVVSVAAPVAIWAGLNAGSVALCFAGLCLTGISYSYAPTATSTFALAFYGRKHFATNFPVLNLTLLAASFVPTLVSGMALSSAYVLMIALALAGAALNIALKKA